jgi:hypothetical protein
VNPSDFDRTSKPDRPNGPGEPNKPRGPKGPGGPNKPGGLNKPGESKEVPVGGGLLASILVIVILIFVIGCLYGLWYWQLPGHPASARRDPGIGILDIVPFGFAASVYGFPTAAVLILAAGYPLFRLWVRRGYLRVGAYVGAGLILSGIGEAILAAGHLVIGLLQGAGLWFAVLFIALCGPTTGCVAWLVMREYLTELAAKTAALDAPRKKAAPKGG